MLIAEDSATARELLVSLFGADPAMEVVGAAANGVQAVEMAKRLRPSLVVMDIQMPEMDGFEATKRIMIEAPTPVIIVTAAHDPRDVEMSLRAVQLGALTMLPKPVGPGSPGFESSAGRLLSLAKALAEVKVVRRRRSAGDDDGDATSGVHATGIKRSLGGGPVHAVAVAASTGGPAALYRFLSRMPSDTSVPVLVVQHIADGFAPGLVTWLSSGTSLPVKLAEHGESLAGGVVYVAGCRHHLEVGPRRTVSLSNSPPVGGFRPSATVLFRSVSAAYASTAVGVILTGMGRDGCDGLAVLRKAGGRVLAQDEATSVVFGMPGAVVSAGLADVVAPVDGLADSLSKLISRRHR
ncbi:MAG TPA: chemotaxis-specific protein-glutamate methyltransferase CheB [Acidimicrobiales bacterium]|nr:chemotaxis-specific protein-glutamate methyltransferase CheB [Acidimicrobiales bacterium]